MEPCIIFIFRTGQQGGTAAAGSGLANPLEQPGDPGTGLSTYNAPRPLQSSGDNINMGASQTKDFRYFLFYCVSTCHMQTDHLDILLKISQHYGDESMLYFSYFSYPLTKKRNNF